MNTTKTKGFRPLPKLLQDSTERTREAAFAFIVASRGLVGIDPPPRPSVLRDAARRLRKEADNLAGLAHLSTRTRRAA